MSLTSDLESQIDALMQAYQGAVPGACVGVIRNGAYLIRRAYGFADLENQVRATSETNYRLASMTKQFTAAAILLLVQDGVLSLRDSVRGFLPSLPTAIEPVTIQHLLTHSAGLLDYEDFIPLGTATPLRDADVLRLLESHNQTYFEPGSAYRYSNGGYALLAMVAERTSGHEYADFLRRRLFEPLGMKDTVAHQAGISTVAHRAYGYRGIGEGAWTRADQSLTSAVLGDGGIYSSIDDLAKWDAALYGGYPLHAQSLRLAFSPIMATADPTVQVGFGWRITGDSLWHSGESTGFRNVIVRYPARHFTVMVLTNREAPEVYETALAIAKLFLPDADRVRAASSAFGPDATARPLPAAT